MSGKRTRSGSIVALTLMGVVAAVGVGVLVSSAEATAPGKNGPIAFKRYLDSGRSTGAIFIVDANGRTSAQSRGPPPDRGGHPRGPLH